MPTYAYQAVDGSGKRLRGNAQAVSTGALTRTLEERGLFVLDVAESAEAAPTKRGVRFGRRREVLEVTLAPRFTRFAGASSEVKRCRRRSRSTASSSRRCTSVSCARESAAAISI